MSRVKIRQFGLDEMDAAFKEMAVTDQKSIIKKSLKAAVFPMESVMRLFARQTKDKNLVSSIGSVTMRKEIGVKVGARIDKGLKGHWGATYEFGTKERHYTTKNGRIHKTGKIKRYEWMTKAVDKTEDYCNELVTGEHYAIMQKIIARNVRKNNKEFISSE